MFMHRYAAIFIDPLFGWEKDFKVYGLDEVFLKSLAFSLFSSRKMIVFGMDQLKIP